MTNCFSSSIKLFTVGRKRVGSIYKAKTWPKNHTYDIGTPARPKYNTLNFQLESTHNKQITILEYSYLLNYGYYFSHCNPLHNVSLLAPTDRASPANPMSLPVATGGSQSSHTLVPPHFLLWSTIACACPFPSSLPLPLGPRPMPANARFVVIGSR